MYLHLEATKNLIQRNTPAIKEKLWYNQRFDASPHFITLVAIADLLAEPRKEGNHSTDHIAFYEHNHCDWYVNYPDLERITQYYVDKATTHKEIGTTLTEQWAADEKHFYDVCLKIREIDLAGLSNEQLRDLYNELTNAVIRAYSGTSIIDGFALGSDQVIATMIQQHLDQTDGDFDSNQVFSTLTAPTVQSFINEQEAELITIAIEAKDKGLDHPDITNKLQAHQQKWFWAKNNYVDDNVLSIEDFRQELSQLIMEDDLADHRQKILDTPQRNEKAKEVLLGQLKLSDQLRELLDFSEKLTAWQDARKKISYWTTHYVSLLLSEIAKRHGYTLLQLKYLIPPEVDSIFEMPLVSPAEADQRFNGCAWYQVGDKYEIVTEGLEELKQMAAPEVAKVTEFKGLVANRGLVSGPVKVVKSVHEIKKVETGDILVAVMTRPDYIAGMKIAAAFVTDEGGITSHAAIVSRELGKPCIIGTKLATKVLQDNDMVEVDANKGIIRKI